MKFSVFDTSIFVSYPAVAFFAVAVLADSSGKIILCLLASALHEAGHIASIIMCKKKVAKVAVKLCDISIVYDNMTMSFHKELFVESCGVVTNFVLTVVFYIIGRIAESYVCLNFSLINLCLGIFNLLPIKTLDGANILALLLGRRFSVNVADKVINIITVFFLIPVATFGFVCLFQSGYNFSMLFAAIYLISTIVLKENI